MGQAPGDGCLRCGFVCDVDGDELEEVSYPGDMGAFGLTVKRIGDNRFCFSFVTGPIHEFKDDRNLTLNRSNHKLQRRRV